MSSLQSGVNSSTLSPQSFKNSSQNNNLQGSSTAVELQQSGSTNTQILNTLQPSNQLQVTSGADSSVLGSATGAGNTPIESNSQQTSNFVGVFILIAVASAILTFAFLGKAINFSKINTQQ